MLLDPLLLPLCAGAASLTIVIVIVAVVVVSECMCVFSVCDALFFFFCSDGYACVGVSVHMSVCRHLDCTHDTGYGFPPVIFDTHGAVLEVVARLEAP